MDIFVDSAIVRIVFDFEGHNTAQGIEHFTTRTGQIEPYDLDPVAGKTITTSIVPFCFMALRGPVRRPTTNFVNELAGKLAIYSGQMRFHPLLMEYKNALHGQATSEQDL